MTGRRWRCFHCGEYFINERDAAEHFGGNMLALTGCQIKGSEYGLLGLIRQQEAELAVYRAENDPLTRAMETMQSEHAIALREAEEIGYDRGIQDAKKLFPDWKP